MKSTIVKTLCTIAVLIFTSSVAGAFTVDGILSADDNYTDVFSIDYVEEGGGEAHTGTMRLGTDTAGDIFVLYEVPTGIHDLTWGANRAAGWGSTDVDYGNIQGSEKLGFKLIVDGSEETVEVKMKDDDAGTGYEVREDGNGALLAASTSLDYNINNVTDYYNSALFDSNDPVFCSNNASDADCYASAVAGLENYQFAQMYEMKFDGAFFDDIADFILKMSSSFVHASPAKSGDKITFTGGCIDTNDCESVNVPHPPMMGLLLAALAGFGLRRARRK